MARIVYGVAGEGLGHAARARVMAAHLERDGHDVKIVSYQRGYASLKDEFDCLENEGLHIGIQDNRVSNFKSVVENVRKSPTLLHKFRDVRRLFDEFEPHAVVSDFEPMTGWLARYRGLPLIAIDNQHAMRYMKIPCPRRLLVNRMMARLIVRGTVPPPDVTLLSTFFSGELTNDRTYVYPPILRDNVLGQTPGRGEHILVYHTRPYESFLDALPAYPRERFIVYGYNRSEDRGNVTHKPFSLDGFLADLVTCKAVMATAGFTLATEALHLRKPILATPQKGQFEQELNAIQLERLGYGMDATVLTPETIGEFLYRIPEIESRLADYPSGDNAGITAKLSALTADDCALAHRFREQRRGRAAAGSAELTEEG